MKLSVIHLNSYLPKKFSAEQIADAIEKSGIELESILSPPRLDKKVVVGLTKKVVQHPAANKLRIVTVDVGTDTPLQIVCGAPSVEESRKVAVATHGASMPDGTKINTVKLRGETSEGMLCTEVELGLGNNSKDLMYLPDDYNVGKALCDIVINDTILDVKTSANRFDLQSYEGISREIAAQLGVVPHFEVAKLQVKGEPDLIAKSDKSVPAFSAIRIDIQKLTATPDAVGRVLEAAGTRQISPVVDITNYINLTVGQPLHAFDAAKISLPLSIRFAKPNEKVTTLNGKTNVLTSEDLVVADVKGPVDIAGVMGGADTEIDVTTKEIVLIASTLPASLVRKTAQRHGIRTDASARYERGIPVEALDRGRALAADMLEKMGAKLVSGARLGAVESEKTTLKVAPAEVSKLLGIEVAPKDFVRYLKSLGFEVSGLAKPGITVPWWRPDINEMADIAEEIIKLVGYDALPATIPPLREVTTQPDDQRRQIAEVRYALRSLGWFEVVTYSFISETHIREFELDHASHLALQNPMSEEQAYMRQSLLASLRDVVVRNQNYAKQFGVFEVSRVFAAQQSKQQISSQEPLVVATAAVGSYSDVKRAVDLLARELHVELSFLPSNSSNFIPGRQAEIMLGSTAIGRLGELHPKLLTGLKSKRRVSIMELQLEPLFAAAQAHQYEPISRYPSITRDIAVVVDEQTLWRDVTEVVTRFVPSSRLKYLSTYRGKGIPDGRKSVALRVVLSSLERTLTDAEADQQVDQIVTALKTDLHAELRA